MYPANYRQPNYESVYTAAAKRSANDYQNPPNNSDNDPSVPALRRSVVTIRNNTNKSLQFKHTANNNISQANYQDRRDVLDAKHKSLFVQGSEYTADCGPERNPIKTTASDYLLNSETLYRNEIRKSCKWVI